MPTYEERLREVRKRSGRISGPSQSELERQKMFEESIKSDPSLVRSVGYAGEALREVPEKEVPLLTDRPELVTKERPTFFISERPEEVAQAKTAGAERAILGRERPEISFGKFGQVIEEPTRAAETLTAKVPARPSAEDLDINEKWEEFKTKYLLPKIGYDPDVINPVQERINIEKEYLSKVDINSLDVDKYNTLKKEAEKKGKLAEDLAKEKIRIGKEKIDKAYGLFKKDIPKEPNRLNFKELNDYLYKMTHDSSGAEFELTLSNMNQLQEMARQSGFNVVRGDEGYAIQPIGLALKQLHEVMGGMSLEAKQRYLQQPDVQEYARKHGIRGQDIGL